MSRQERRVSIPSTTSEGKQVVISLSAENKEPVLASHFLAAHGKEHVFSVTLAGKRPVIPVTPQLVRFGVFELDLNTGELCKNGRKLKLQEQPFRLLGLLLEQPGQPVTRDRLKEVLWPSDTFVDFDHSLNAAIAKLRQALGDSAENPRFIETLARRGYRFIAPVEITRNSESNLTPVLATASVPVVSPVQEISTAPATPAIKSRIRIGPVAAIALAAVAVLAVFGLRFWQKTQPDQSTMVQLTNGAGLTMDPAVSPDGKLLAYASDRADGRNLNIWIQQLAPAGTAVQLTNLEADSSEPSFSQDGSRIVFRSTEDGGGMYTISTIGGEPTRLGLAGRNPRYSPDGQWIAYWVGVHGSSVLTGEEGGEVYVLPAAGGQPRRLGTDLRHSGNPVWGPDGKHLVVFCPEAADDSPTWCVISLNGEPSRRTGLFDILKRQGFSIGRNRIPRVSQWTRGFLLFSAVYGDAFNVWRMPVSDEGRSLGRAERLTSGTTLEASGLLTTSGDLIFSSLNLVQSIWSLPLDADRARLTGELKKITDGPTEAEPSISLDGRNLVFVTNQNPHHNSAQVLSEEPATFQVRIKDFSTGKEDSVQDAEPVRPFPQISKDGTLLAYSSGEHIRIVQIDHLPPSMNALIENRSKAWDWSADNKRLLVGTRPAASIHTLNISSGRESLFLSKPGYSLFQAKFSPDNRAVVLVACAPTVGCRLFVAPLKSDGTPETDNWIEIDHPSWWDDKPRWSPDGNLIYFISDRDGQFCLWAQRLENRTKQPVGTPFALYHFHNSRLAMDNVGVSDFEIAVARNKIVMGLGDLTGNIWSLKR